MAHLPPDHPLLKVYLHLKDRGQAELADTLADYADMAARQQAQLELVQAYVSELDKRTGYSYGDQQRQQAERRYAGRRGEQE
jgi:hypothetical protein